MAKNCVVLRREMDTIDETSNVFVLYAPIGCERIEDAYKAYSDKATNIVKRFQSAYNAVDQKVLATYKVNREQIRPVSDEVVNAIKRRKLNRVFFTRSLISHLAGVPFGRWDIRYATGEREPPPLPDPFAPLPACPPGMLQNAQGLPAAPEDVRADYPLRISWGGVLVDDPGHPEDIVGRVREALAVIWGQRAEAIEAAACDILGVDSLREYFQKPNLFFADHLKRYSKSRRYAPIYWPLSTASGSYTLWLYYHRLTDQTLYTCVNDFVDPKLKQVAEDLSRLRQKRPRTRDEETELARLTDFETELKEFREELLRVAAFWKPNLNDGVQITAAPLWKLFRHRQWQKRLKATWEKLEAGEYDWAHLAYSIWPERVREKCKHDKSLAIAHDLEHLYIEPPQKAKKRRGRKKAGSDQGELEI